MPVQLLGGESVRYPFDVESGFTLRADAICERIGPRTKAIIINSLSNSTGSVVERKELEAIVEIVQEHSLYLISDEAYDHILFYGTRPVL